MQKNAFRKIWTLLSHRVLRGIRAYDSVSYTHRSEKELTSRVAVASGKIRVNAKVMEAVKNGTSKKVDVLGVARVAGIMAVKQTANLIPMCHTLLISKCEIEMCIRDRLTTMEKNMCLLIQHVCEERIRLKRN